MKSLLVILALTSSTAFAGIVCNSPSKVVFPNLQKKYELVKEFSEGILTIESNREGISFQGRLIVNNHYRLINTDMHSSGGHANLKFDNTVAKELSEDSQNEEKSFIKIEKRKPSDCRLSRGSDCFLKPERMITIIKTDERFNKVTLSNYRMSHDVYKEYKLKGESALPGSYSYFTATYENCSF